MFDIKGFISSHAMVTGDTAAEGMKVLILEEDGIDWGVKEGIITKVEPTGEHNRAYVTYRTTEINGREVEKRRRIKSKDYYERHPLAIDKGPIKWVTGEHSGVYLP